MIASLSAFSGDGVERHRRAHEPAGIERLADSGQHFGDVKGLQDIVERPHAGSFYRRLGGAEGRHDDHRQLGLHRMQPLKGLQPVHARQPDIQNHKVRATGRHGFQTVLGRGGAENLIAFPGKQFFETAPQLVVIINDQDRVHGPTPLPRLRS